MQYTATESNEGKRKGSRTFGDVTYSYEDWELGSGTQAVLGSTIRMKIFIEDESGEKVFSHANFSFHLTSESSRKFFQPGLCAF